MGNAKTHERKRNRMRKQLRAAGWSPAAIEQAIARKARDQAAARAAGVAMPDLRKKPEVRKSTKAEVRATHAVIDEQFEDLQRRSIDAARARQLDVENEVYGVDDTRHRPAGVDSLKRGAARVTGVTAKAIGRKKALTKFEHDQLQSRGGV